MIRERMTRRECLKIGAALGLTLVGQIVLPVAVLSAREESVPFSRFMHTSTRVDLLMGTFVSLTALDPSRDKSQDALGRAMNEMQRLTAMFTRHDSGGRIHHLNTHGSLDDVPPELKTVMDQAIAWSRATGGGFDPTILPLIELIEKKLIKTNGVDMHDPDIIQALDGVDASAIEMTQTRIRFTRENMKVTLDAIAKGYIVDKGAEILLASGIKNFLINAGGDIRANGSPDTGNKRAGWSVAIQDPKKQKKYPEVMHLASGALATSGEYESGCQGDITHFHIIDPRTGRSPGLPASASVIAPSAMQADALSTAVFAMGPHHGLQLFDSLPEHACLILSHSGSKRMSRNWNRYAQRGHDQVAL